MTSKHVETIRASHGAFNERNFAALAAGLADDCNYVDIPRGVTAKGKAAVIEHLKGWLIGFTNARAADPQYLDGGTFVTAMFHGEGKNDGQFGPFPPTQKSAKFAICEIAEFDAAGKISRITAYYDQYGILAQLGHVPAPPN